MKKVGGLLRIYVTMIIGLLILSNVDKGFIQYEPDKLQIQVQPDIELINVVARHTNTKIDDEKAGIVGVPYGTVEDELSKWKQDPDVKQVSLVEVKLHFSLKRYLFGLYQQMERLFHGDLGGLTYNSRLEREYPIASQFGNLAVRSLRYLVCGLILGVTLGYGLALLGIWKPRVGKVLGVLHSVLLGIPDFFLVALLQFGAIGIAKLEGHQVITILQFVDDVPFLIPMLSISILPGLLLYGTLRIAIDREWEQTYVKTAYSKGLSRVKVLFVHMLRNTVPDMISILPRLASISITSLVMAEVMCGIFGLGGYAINKDLWRVTSLTVTCGVLALFVIAVHLVSSWLESKFVIKHEGGAISEHGIAGTRMDTFWYYVALSWMLVLLFIACFGTSLLPQSIANVEPIPWIKEQVNGVTKYVYPPFPPSSSHWLGTDHRGYDILWLVLNGMKYTIGFAFLVAAVRYVIALPLGLWSGLTGRMWVIVSWMQGLTASVPVLLFLFPLLYGLRKAGLGLKPLAEPEGLVFAEILFGLLVFFGVFQIAEQFASRANHFRGALYIEAAQLMGASKARLIRMHLMPQLRTEFFWGFLMEFVQVLFLLGQLAVLGFFIGGGEMFGFDGGYGIPLTTTGEWGGLIAYGIRTVRYAPWILASAGIAMTISILCLVFYSRHLQKRLERPRNVRTWEVVPMVGNRRFWVRVGTVMAVCIALSIVFNRTQALTPTTKTYALPETTSQNEAKEKLKQAVRKYAEDFMKQIVAGNWTYASSYFADDKVGSSQPAKPFDRWMAGFTQQGYSFSKIGEIVIPEPDSKNPNVLPPIEIEINVRTPQGQSEIWTLSSDGIHITGGQGGPQ